ncbi:MAG TPA: cytochrome P450, partial [Vicinamibacteria bacterium]|nr:cytochrome P450 [Vicinamibacteria bacterium]
VTRQHDFSKSRALQWAKLFLGEGLLTSEGEFHTRQRRLAQPAFHRQRIGGYGADMVRRAASAREGWRAGEVLDVDAEMMRLTLAVVSSTLFGIDVATKAEDVREDLAALISLFPRFSLPFFGLIQRLPLPSNARFDRAVGRLDALVNGLIAERRRDRIDRGDLLSMLLLAQDEEGDGGGMSDRQLRDEVMTLLLAGHETTSNALTWTWYLLSQHAEVEGRWRDELRTVLDGRLPSFEDLPALPYTEKVLAESMRLFPPAWGIGRRALRDVELGGFVVPAGTVVALAPNVVHRDVRFWAQPDVFDPERFTPEAKAARPRFAYFPFGGGARSCIGEPFAWMEGVLLLATLGQRWKLRLFPGHRVEPQALITLRPRYGMRMIAEPAS